MVTVKDHCPGTMKWCVLFSRLSDACLLTHRSGVDRSTCSGRTATAGPGRSLRDHLTEHRVRDIHERQAPRRPCPPLDPAVLHMVITRAPARLHRSPVWWAAGAAAAADPRQHPDDPLRKPPWCSPGRISGAAALQPGTRRAGERAGRARKSASHPRPAGTRCQVDPRVAGPGGQVVIGGRGPRASDAYGDTAFCQAGMTCQLSGGTAG